MVHNKSLLHKTSNDWNGKQYNTHSQFQYKSALNAIDQLTLTGNEKILDIGSGDGKITALLAQKVPLGEVHGIDISENMIQFAREKYQNISNLTFEVADITNTIFKNKFDIIVSFMCLHWIKNQEIALQNIAKNLKPPGKILISVGCPESLYLDTKMKTINSTRWKKYFQSYEYPIYLLKKADLITKIKNAELNSLFIKFINKPYVFPTKQALLSWAEAIPHGKNRIPLDLQKKFINNLINRYIEKNPLNIDGSVKLTIPYLLIMAEKKLSPS